MRLRGTKSNRSAIGARVVVRSGSRVQAQEAMSQSSYVSANDPRLHFGLGSFETVEIEVRWPLGTTQAFKGIATNQLITLIEGSAEIQTEKLVAAATLK